MEEGEFYAIETFGSTGTSHCIAWTHLNVFLMTLLLWKAFPLVFI
jgi:hypothetical protein